MIIEKLKKITALMLSLALANIQGTMSPLWAQETSAAPRITLDNIQVGNDKIELELSAPAKYNTFVTANPPRLVLEILNTDFHMTSKSWSGKGQYLKRVRSGQFKQKPNPITRVVLDLTDVVDYKVSSNADGLEVDLNPGKSLSQAPKVAPDQAASDDSSAQSEKTDNSGFHAMKTDTSPELAAIAKHSSIMPQAPGSESSMNDAPASSPARQLAITGVKRARRDIIAMLPREPISLDFDNTDINDVLKLLANKTNLNIVTGPDVSGNLSLHLNNVPFNEAFSLVLSMQGLVANQVGDNVLRVMTPPVLEKERATTVGVTRVFQLNYSKADDVKSAIDAVRAAERRTGSTVVDKKNNAIIVTDTPEGHAAIERLLAQIDVRPRQVLIEAKLVEVSLTKDLALGIQWDYFGSQAGQALGKQGYTTVGAVPLPTTAPGQTVVTQPYNQEPSLNFPAAGSAVGATGRGTGVNLAATNALGAFTLGRVTNNYFLSATLTAAASQGKVKVLSDPKIATLNGQQATINITTQRPYSTTTSVPNGPTSTVVNYQTTGIQLSVTPIINADGRITLKVDPNVSQPSAIAAVSVGGAVATDSRVADTTVLVKDGETIVIGGMITDSLSNTTASIPLLGDIPIIGWLFKNKTVTRNRVELLIFVTPKIMPD